LEKDAKSLLKQTLELADDLLDADRVAQAKRRQADMFAWRESDFVPIIFGLRVQSLEGLPDFDWTEQFFDPAASLYMQMKDVVRLAAGGSDYVPTVRADTGVINGPSVLGAGYDVPAHTKPVVNRRVDKGKLAAFQVPDDIRGLGVIPRMIEHTQHHLAVLAEAGLDDRVGIRHCDTQGPFDIAAQAYGHDEIFLDFYRDADFVWDLMSKCTDIYVKLARLCKELVGHPPDNGYANEYWMDRGSVRVCDDSGILVSAEQFAEHLAPHVAEALAPFGGGWIHYCGGVPDGNRPEGLHLHEVYCSIPGMRGLQFTTGADWPAEIRRVIDRKVVYLGGLPRGRDEPLEEYFRRALSLCPGRRGMIFSADVRTEEAPSAVGSWRRVQHELWPD